MNQTFLYIQEEASSKNNWTSSTRVIEISVNGDTGEKFFQIVIDQPTSASQSRNEGTELSHKITQ